MLPIASYRGIDLVTATSGTLHDEFVQTADTSVDLLHGNFRATGVEFNAIGQSWDSGADPQEVVGVVARLSLTGEGRGIGLIRCSIYAHSGVFGTSSVPTGNPLTSSPWYAVEDLASSSTNYFFPMSGWTPAASTDYVVVIEHDAPWGDSSYMRAVIEDGAEATHGGNLSEQAADSSWTAQSAQDVAFKVYYTSSSGTGPGGSGGTPPGWLRRKSRRANKWS